MGRCVWGGREGGRVCGWRWGGAVQPLPRRRRRRPAVLHRPFAARCHCPSPRLPIPRRTAPHPPPPLLPRRPPRRHRGVPRAHRTGPPHAAPEGPTRPSAPSGSRGYPIGSRRDRAPAAAGALSSSAPGLLPLPSPCSRRRRSLGPVSAPSRTAVVACARRRQPPPPLAAWPCTAAWAAVRRLITGRLAWLRRADAPAVAAAGAPLRVAPCSTAAPPGLP